MLADKDHSTSFLQMLVSLSLFILYLKTSHYVWAVEQLSSELIR